jgi:hypothetical protein
LAVSTRVFVDRLAGFIRATSPPEAGYFRETIRAAVGALRSDPPSLRPPDPAGRPGGLLQLDREIPTVVVPDIHGRRELLLRVLAYQTAPGARTLQLLARGRLQVLCLGDGMHAEARAARRWRSARGEFDDDWHRHENMDQEMTESLGVMGMVMEAKRAFPGHFHFLKGNHENITNEEGGGNFPFRKFAEEGRMVLSWMRRFYGEEILASLAAFEKELPLLAVGRGFMASHAEPGRFFSRERIIDGRGDAEVVAGLTWTDNGESEPGTVEAMLRSYLGPEGTVYFAGHRAVDADALRPAGPFVQLHDPTRMTMALLDAGGEIDLEAAIRRLAGDVDAG